MRKNFFFLGALVCVAVFSLKADIVQAWSPTGSTPIVSCGQVDASGNLDSCDWDDFVTTAGNVIDALLWFASLIAAIVFAIAGFTYLTAGGNPGQVSKAHNMFKMVAIGFAIALSGWLIVTFITDALLAGGNPLLK